MSESITAHGDVTGGGVFRFPQPSWRDPDGDHAYRGAGHSGPGHEGLVWDLCLVCGAEHESDQHGQPWRSCSYCGSIHPVDLLALGEIVTAAWADFKYGWPHKLYVDLPRGQRAKFYATHFSDFPELIEPFNTRFGYCGVTFRLADDGRIGWRRVL